VSGASILRCKAILFDLDGVLVNSAECVEKTWRSFAARHQLDVDKVLVYAHGRRTKETVELVAPDLDAEHEVKTLERNEAMTTEGVYEVPAARELLESLPSDRWAIVTSGIRAVADLRIRFTRLPPPSVMICADDIMNGKPHPEGYLKAAENLGRLPAECIVIEDALAGIEAAHAAGMRVIAIASTYGRARLADADLVVDQLSDLTVLFDGEQIVISSDDA
jgi:sugar-phosphatase